MLSGGAPKEPIVIWKNLGWLRGLAIALVAFNHGTKYTVFLGQSAKYDWSWHELLVLILGRCIGPICIPIFLVASGYFMGRFTANWSSAKGAVKTFALRYACWSLVVYAATWLLTREFDLGKFLFGFFVAGQAFPTYWFAVVLIHFYLLTPWLTDFVAKRTGAALGLAAFLLVLAMLHGYLDMFGIHVLPAMYFTPFVAPFFILGLLFAKRCDWLVGKLAPYRRHFGILALVFLPLNVLEVVGISYLHGDRTPLTWGWDAGDRLGLHLFSLSALFWLVLSPARSTALRRGLDWVGVRSLALLLCLDPFMKLAFMFCWHIERVLGLTDRPSSQPPDWIANAWLSIWFTAVAMAGPLLAVVVTERLLGKRIRTLVFG